MEETQTVLQAELPVQQLKNAVRFVTKIALSNPNPPVLAGVMLDTTGGELVVSMFNLETYIRETLQASRVSPGRALVSGKALQRLLGKLVSKSTAWLAVDGGQLTLEAGGVTFRLELLPAGDYPSAPPVEGKSVCTLTGGQLAAAGSVANTASREQGMPLLHQIHMSASPGDGELAFACTDRYRVARYASGVTPDVLDSEGVMVEADALRLASDHMRAASEVEMRLIPGWSDLTGEWHNVTLESSTRLLSTRVFTGWGDERKFPDWRKKLDEEYPPSGGVYTAVVDVDAGGLLDAASRVSVAAERNTPVRVELGDGSATVWAAAGDELTAESTVTASVERRSDDAPGLVAFSPRYLTEGLQMLGGTVRMELSTHWHPAMLTSGSAPGVAYLLMPINTQEG